MKIIISGASGYIGSALIQSFLKDEIKPTLLTRLLETDDFTKDLVMYTADITKPIAVELKETYDCFIHLAAANDIDSVHPETALMATTLGTRNALEFCKKNGIKKFIYFSTFQVLGKVDGFIDEKTVPMPSNDYGITHYFAEEYVKMYTRTNGINYIILRPTNIYGAPVKKNIDRWTLVPNCFCKESMEHKTITLLSSGKQMRDFLNLKDLVNITKLYAMQFEKFQNQTVHVSSGNNFTIIEIAQIVKNEFEKMFNDRCELLVKSELPKTQNEYQIDRSLMEQTGYKFDDKNSIVQEINAIFNLLKN